LHISRNALLALALVGLAGCTSGQIGTEPASTPVNLNQNKMEFAVGIATYVNGAATVKALNVVPSFRQPSGLSAVLVDTPLLTGPFTVPAAASGAGVDASTNHISGSPQVTPAQTAVASTFGVTGGIFSYGFAPVNNSATGTPSGAASYALYAYPRYSAGAAAGDLAQITYRGGPPAYPRTTDGTYPAGFTGYSQGFATFELTPVAGTYNLSAGIQDSSGNTTTIGAPAVNLASTTGLPVFAAPAAAAFVRDGAGGASLTFTAPAGVTETIVDAFDSTQGTYYTVVVGGSGAQTAVFPPAIGPGAVAGKTFLTGDKISIYLVGADYPAFEAGPPANTQQLPTLAGANGQADLTFAPTLAITY
jgi:hypothetical protein